MKSLAQDYDLSLVAIKEAINSTPDDNRMTPKEVREGKEAWKKLFG